MIAFFFCGILGLLQIFILSKILEGVLSGNMKKTVVNMLLKFGLYAVGFTLLYFCFLNHIYQCGAGFIVGVIAAVIIILIKSKKQGAFNKAKGDDVNEHGRTN